MAVDIELLNGLVFGVEHVSADDTEYEDGFRWAVAVHFGFIRILFIKFG